MSTLTPRSLPSGLRTLGVVDAIDRRWSHVRYFFACLKTAWVATASVVLGFLLFGATPQVQDLFLEVRGGASGSGILPGAPLWLAFYLAVVLVWALPVYISARWILASTAFPPRSDAGADEIASRQWLRRHIPPLLAVGCLGAVVLGQFMALENAPSILEGNREARYRALNAEFAQVVARCKASSIPACEYLVGIGPITRGLAAQLELYQGGAAVAWFYGLLAVLIGWLALRRVPGMLAAGWPGSIARTLWWAGMIVIATVALLGSPVIYEYASVEAAKPLGLGHLTVLPALTLIVVYLTWLGLRPRPDGAERSISRPLPGGRDVPAEARLASPAAPHHVGPVFHVVLVLSVALIAVPFIVDPVDVGRYVSRAQMLPFLLGLLVAPFTWLSRWSIRSRVPLVLVAVIAISGATLLAGDTNDVRTVAGSPPREPLRKAIERWAAVNDCSLATPEAARACPSPIIVAAAGGASRSAFHVAGVIGKLMDETTREIRHTGHQEPVSSVIFSPDGRRIVTTSADDTARIWDRESGKELALLRQPHYYARVTGVRGAAFSPDGRLLVTAHRDVRARVWDATTGKLVAVNQGHSGDLVTASFSPGGRRIVTSSLDRTARIFDAQTGKQIVVLRGHEHVVSSASFSADGRRILTSSDDGTARVWNAGQGASLLTLKGHAQAVNKASWSPDGSLILTASDDGSAGLWNAADGKPIIMLKGHTDAIYDAAFSADGHRIVTASDDMTARIWNVSSGETVAILKGHTDKVRTASFSSDGRRVVTASHDATARIWDAASGAPIAVAKGHQGTVNAAAFSPDGRWIATASDDKLARVWDASTGAPAVDLTGYQERRRLQPFSTQLFAISAVSGGALAAVTTFATIADSQRKEHAVNGRGKPPCKDGVLEDDWFASAVRSRPSSGASQGPAWKPHESWRGCLQQLLAGDFLSPVMATLATSDLVHVRGTRGDRGAVLEMSWERRYARLTGQADDASSLSEPLVALRNKVLAEDSRNWLPILLLNGTSVTTGRRIVTSDVETWHAGPNDTPVFKDSEDLHRLLSVQRWRGQAQEGRDIRLSTGATMSARFPVISPHGNIRGTDGGIMDRVVDGGYFENYGATTASELSRVLKELGLEPFIILIINEPSTFTMACNPETSRVPWPEAPPTTWFATLGSPLNALMGTRQSRGTYAASELCTLIGRLDQYAFITVAGDRNKSLSMSWWLSKHVQQYLDDQLAHKINADAFKMIEAGRRSLD